MNTDNMAISGETIDYGPCAFMDTYHPNTVFSSIDTGGRYAYDNQPKMAGWDLTRFAEALLPLLHEDQEQAIQHAEDALSSFTKIFHTEWVSGMCSKLGLAPSKNEERSNEDLISQLLNLTQKYKADYTLTYRYLTSLLAVNSIHEIENQEQFAVSSLMGSVEFARWKEKWEERLTKQEISKKVSLQMMREHNPVIIPRNHLVEEALSDVVHQGDYGKFDRLLQALNNPFDDKSELPLDYTQTTLMNSNYRTFCGT
ncbi:hypothetical protein D3C77_458880 [compost metagenome]